VSSGCSSFKFILPKCGLVKKRIRIKKWCGELEERIKKGLAVGFGRSKKNNMENFWIEMENIEYFSIIQSIN